MFWRKQPPGIKLVAMFEDKYALWLDAMDRVERDLKPICAKAPTIATPEEWQKQPDPLDAAAAREVAPSTLVDMVTSYESASADHVLPCERHFKLFVFSRGSPGYLLT